jgi:hypothetical protein
MKVFCWILPGFRDLIVTSLRFLMSFMQRLFCDTESSEVVAL